MSVGTCCVPGTRAMPGAPAGGEDLRGGGLFSGALAGAVLCLAGEAAARARAGGVGDGIIVWTRLPFLRQSRTTLLRHGQQLGQEGQGWAGSGPGQAPPPHHTEALPLPWHPLSYSSYLGQQSPVGPSLLGPTAQLWGQITDGRADELRAGVGGSLAAQP